MEKKINKDVFNGMKGGKKNNEIEDIDKEFRKEMNNEFKK